MTRFHSTTTTLVQSRAPVSALPTAQVRLETRQAHVRDHRRRVEGVCRAATRGDSGGPHIRGARIAIATLSCEVDLTAARVWASPLRASDALADRDRAGRGARVGEEEEERGRAAGSGEVREYGYGGSQRAGLEARVARAQGIQGATPACPRRPAKTKCIGHWITGGCCLTRATPACVMAGGSLTLKGPNCSTSMG